MFEVYRQLGTPEVEDQINVMKSLQQQYSFISAENTGIWGWSYGGYATAMTLAKDTENVFACGKYKLFSITTFTYGVCTFVRQFPLFIISQNKTYFNHVLSYLKRQSLNDKMTLQEYQ